MPGGPRIVCPRGRACCAGPARADHTATDFTLSPASPEAGASVNASSSTTLSYGTLTEDVKKTIGHFAPGLLANPEAVPHCRAGALGGRRLPGGHVIGSSQAVINGLVVEPGRIYNQELLADEAGRLGIIVDAATGQAVPDRSVLRAHHRRLRARRHPRRHSAADPRHPDHEAQLHAVRDRATGATSPAAPTSCSLKVSTGEAFGYEHNVSVGGPSSSYTPTRCETLPFKPTFDMRVGSPRHHRRAPAPADDGARHPAARRGGDPRQRRHAAVRDRPAPRRPGDGLHERPARGGRMSRRARRWARRTPRRRSSPRR